MSSCHLSIVAASRNDNHGGQLLTRMQHFVSGVIYQCNKHKLDAELIIVDWNPPGDKPPLSEVLELPDQNSCCQVRFITVPNEIHMGLKYAERLPLFQMIAKNVGIRRARGKFVLATNIDILFSDALMIYLRDHLLPGFVYRTDRYDVPSNLPKSGDMECLLEFCKKQVFRINGRYATQILDGNKWVFVEQGESSKPPILKRIFITYFIKKYFNEFFTQMKMNKHSLLNICRRFYRRFYLNAHTNACGDFTLLSKEDWMELRGYPEIEGYSWHLDSFFLYHAIVEGKKEIELSEDEVIYHIEHEQSSGYTPEQHNALFKRLEKEKIPCLSDDDLLMWITSMKRESRKKRPFLYNDTSWGFGNTQFKETSPISV